jgi:hypothetical protein
MSTCDGNNKNAGYESLTSTIALFAIDLAVLDSSETCKPDSSINQNEEKSEGSGRQSWRSAADCHEILKSAVVRLRMGHDFGMELLQALGLDQALPILHIVPHLFAVGLAALVRQEAHFDKHVLGEDAKAGVDEGHFRVGGHKVLCLWIC